MSAFNHSARQTRTIDARPLLVDLALSVLVVTSAIHFSGRLPSFRWLAMLACSFGLAFAATRWLWRRWSAAGSSPAIERWTGRLMSASAPIPAGRRTLRFIACLLLAALATTLRIDSQLATRLDPALEGQILALDLMIDQIADRGSFGDRLLATVETCRPVEAKASLCDNLTRVQLSWSLERPRDRDEDDVAPSLWPRPGERWSLTARAKRPAAPVNDGAFDLELRLLEEGIGAILRVQSRRRIEDPSFWRLAWRAPAVLVERWRDGLREAVEARAAGVARNGGRPPWATLALVNALALGDQRGLPAADWALFSRTGVSHLMAISGMHVTLIAWLASLVVAACLKRLAARGVRPVLALTRRFGRPPLILATTVGFAFGYALLSGWGIASQRTCWMLLTASLVSLMSRASGPLAATLAATLPILLIDPWAVSAAGFWLSFGAVLAIIWQAGGSVSGPPPLSEAKASLSAAPPVVGFSLRHWCTPLSRRFLSSLPARFGPQIAAIVGSQWAATIALLPLTVALFASASVIGPLVNLFAIPWVSFVITPAALLLTLSAVVPWPDWLPFDPWAWGWRGAALAIEWMMAGLHLADRWSWASVRIAAPPAPLLLAAVIGAVWLLAPRGTGPRWLGLAGLLPLLLAGRLQPPPEQLQVTAFDIGLGSAVLVEAADARILIDTGGGQPGPDGPGVASRTIVPALARRGHDRIDAMIVSHRDREHSAGVATVMKMLKPTWLISAFDPRWLPIDPDAVQWQPCRAGQRLDVGSVRIEMLWPTQLAQSRREADDNGRSCVVRLSHRAGSLVAAGDLPQRQEKAVVRRQAGDPAQGQDLVAPKRLAGRSSTLAVPTGDGPQTLKADLLVVPGQGSRAAAGEALLAAVLPSLALIQTARAQRQRVVHPDLLARLESVGAEVLRTDLDGAVTVVLSSESAPQIWRVRLDGAPYWRVSDESTGQTAGR